MVKGETKPQQTTKTSSTPKRKTTTTSTDSPKMTRSRLKHVEENVCDVLLDLMCASPNHAVRVSAAKALMNKMKIMDKAKKHDKRPHDKQERAAVLQELLGLLVELADAKSGGGVGANKMDPLGTS